MNIQPFYTSLKVAALVTALTYCAGARAVTTPATPVVADSNASQTSLQDVAFRDSAEAGMLRRAYVILATGDHDYKGHRARAMKAVERAGKPLGMDLSGDLKDRTPQPLSDDKLREAQGLINQVLGAAEVKDQKRVFKDLTEAVDQINVALKTR